MMEFVRNTVKYLLEHAVNYVQIHLLDKKAGLYTAKDNPELIEAVTKEIQGKDSHLILSRLEEMNDHILNLEKALYHLAGRQQDMLLQQKDMEKVLVATATSVEEIVHGIDNTEIPTGSDDEFLVDAWDTKKTTSSPSN